jgi:hypothetical protein
MIKFRRLDNKGAVSPLLLALMAVTLLFLGSLVFGLMQMGKAKDFQNNFDKKVATELNVQSAKIAEQKQAEFDEKEKAPFKFWTSSTQFGSIKIGFPKTWSNYIDIKDGSTGSGSIDFYAHPDYVPSTGTKDQKYALRMVLKDDNYSSILDKYKRSSEEGDLEISTIQIGGVSGIKVKGQIAQKTTGEMVIFQIREKVLTVWTESVDYQGDFENIILKQLSFIP